MKTLRASLLRLAGLFSRNARRRDADFAAEIESHLQLHIDDNLRAGMDPVEARRMALVTLNGLEATREAYRDQGTVPILEHLSQDVRFAIRHLRKNPGFACAAILVLALGISASVSIFSFVDAALIKPLPFRDPNRLMDVTGSVESMRRSNISYLDYIDWREKNEVFQSLDVYTGNGFLMRTASGMEPVTAGQVSHGFFRTLGVSPILGRDFSEIEDKAGAQKVVMLSHIAWTKRFGGRPEAVGEVATLGGMPYVIIGVLPPEFQFAPNPHAELWTAIKPDGGCERRRSCHNMDGVARLKDGVPVETARANMATIAKQLEIQYPDSNRGRTATVAPLTDLISGATRPILLALFGGAALLLLIACVNVASLLLVRSESRRREMAVRTALGASGLRLVSQFLTEAVVLIAVGSALGLLGANGAIRVLVASIPNNVAAFVPFLKDVGLNPRVLLFATAVSVLIGILLALTPIVHASFSKLLAGLAEGSRGSAGVAWRRLDSKLVVAELAIAVVLLVGAGLLGKSLSNLLNVELGFQPAQLATISVAAPQISYGKSEQQVALGRKLVENIAALPGVEAVGLATQLPVTYNGNTTWIRIKGKPYNGEHHETNERDVSSDYFKTIGAKLVAGRYFTEDDDATKPAVTLINQTLARKHFPGGENPIGQQIGDTTLSAKSMRTVVGVVADIKEGALDSEIWPAIYHPLNQDPANFVSVVVRTAQSPISLLPLLGKTARQIDSDLGAFGEATFADLIDNSQTAFLHRFAAWLVGGFAALALLLSVVGLYGVVAYSVSQRTREIGVRMALGAQSASVYRLILEEAGWLATLGIAIGLLMSIAFATIGRSVLFGVSTWDLPTLAAVALLLGVAALLASYVPARRAAAVNPVEALRAE